MAQLNIYVPEEMANALKRRARRERRSLSALVVALLDDRASTEQWPKGFFETVLGHWQGPLGRIERRPAEERDDL